MGLDTDTATHDCEQNHAGIPSASPVYGYGVQSPAWRHALVGQRGEVTCRSKRRNSGCLPVRSSAAGSEFSALSACASTHAMRPENTRADCAGHRCIIDSSSFYHGVSTMDSWYWCPYIVHRPKVAFRTGPDPCPKPC